MEVFHELVLRAPWAVRPITGRRLHQTTLQGSRPVYTQIFFSMKQKAATLAVTIPIIPDANANRKRIAAKAESIDEPIGTARYASPNATIVTKSAL
jgi:hypothetical protein